MDDSDDDSPILDPNGQHYRKQISQDSASTLKTLRTRESHYRVHEVASQPSALKKFDMNRMLKKTNSVPSKSKMRSPTYSISSVASLESEYWV